MAQDFADYRQWLEAHQVETAHMRVSEHFHTARFLCTTDADNNQITSFYAGAMNEDRRVDLARILRSALGTDSTDALGDLSFARAVITAAKACPAKRPGPHLCSR
jgi:sugar/nucleoside kinase (ribokinase family)